MGSAPGWRNQLPRVTPHSDLNHPYECVIHEAVVIQPDAPPNLFAQGCPNIFSTPWLFYFLKGCFF